MLSLTDPRVEVLMHQLYLRPGGVTAREVSMLIAPPMSRRTLQRWLAGLVGSGLLAVKGKGIATRYLAPTNRRGRKPSLVAQLRVAPGAVGAGRPPRTEPTNSVFIVPPGSPATVQPVAPMPGAVRLPTIPADRVPAILKGVVGALVTFRILPDTVRQELRLKAALVLREGESFQDLVARGAAS